jgi:transcriptional regulator with XRE-family HTH domain
MHDDRDHAATIVANARRLMLGRKKAQIARRAGIERTKLYRFLGGVQVLRADELQRLAEALHVDVGAFYGVPAPRPDFQSAFLKNDDFALRISGLLLGPDESPPAKDTTQLADRVKDVAPDTEAERIVRDLCDVLQSRALSAFAFIGAWVLLWERMSVDEGIQMARAVRRILPRHADIMVRVGTVCYRQDAARMADLADCLATVRPEGFYVQALGHLRYVLSLERIDQTASLAHKILEKQRHRTQESVHRRLLALKRTIDLPDAPEFWARLLTYLDPNVP